jgi:hypothetical protein
LTGGPYGAVSGVSQKTGCVFRSRHRLSRLQVFYLGKGADGRYGNAGTWAKVIGYQLLVIAKRGQPPYVGCYGGSGALRSIGDAGRTDEGRRAEERETGKTGEAGNIQRTTLNIELSTARPDRLARSTGSGSDAERGTGAPASAQRATAGRRGYEADGLKRGLNVCGGGSPPLRVCDASDRGRTIAHHPSRREIFAKPGLRTALRQCSIAV